MDIQRGLANVNGTQLYYEAAGEGPPLVLLHGFSLDCRIWDDQFLAFAQGHRVLRYDLRGFGRSALPSDEPFGHEQDLRALLDHLGVRRAAIVGLSLGGMVAIDFALTYPQATHALLVVDGLFAGYRFSAEWDQRTGLVWELAREFGMFAAKESWLGHPLFEPLAEKPEANARVQNMVGEYSGWHFVHSNRAISPEPAAARRLKNIDAPVLVIVGERDLPDFHRMAETLEREAPHARRVVLPHAGHMANIEEPAAFNHLVLEFLRTLPGY